MKYLRVSSIWLVFAPAHDDSCFAKLKILPTFISELLQIKLLGAQKLVLDYVPLAAPLSCVRFEALITTDPTPPIFDLAFTCITLFNPLVIVLVKPGVILALEPVPMFQVRFPSFSCTALQADHLRFLSERNRNERFFASIGLLLQFFFKSHLVPLHLSTFFPIVPTSQSHLDLPPRDPVAEGTEEETLRVVAEAASRFQDSQVQTLCWQATAVFLSLQH